jgi:hypothetical protein
MFQGFVNKMTVIMKLAAMGPIDIPPWCNVFLFHGVEKTSRLRNSLGMQVPGVTVVCKAADIGRANWFWLQEIVSSYSKVFMAKAGLPKPKDLANKN